MFASYVISCRKKFLKKGDAIKYIIFSPRFAIYDGRAKRMSTSACQGCRFPWSLRSGVDYKCHRGVKTKMEQSGWNTVCADCSNRAADRSGALHIQFEARSWDLTGRAILMLQRQSSWSFLAPFPQTVAKVSKLGVILHSPRASSVWSSQVQ